MRLGLRSWADALALKLRHATADGNLLDLSEFLNKAALLFAYAGDFGTSYWLCDQQLDWVRNLARIPANMVLAFQPWINQGRIHLLTGDFDAAIEKFSLHSEVASGTAGRFAYRLGCAQEDLIRLRQEERRALTAVFQARVIDTWKAFAAESKWNDSLSFVRDVASSLGCESAGGLGVVVNEALIQSLRGVGQPDDARRVAGVARASSTSLYVEAIFALRCLECESDLGRLSKAGLLELEGLGKLTAAGVFDAVDVQAQIRFTDALASMSRACDLESLSGHLWQRALRLSLGIGDEPFQARFLDLLSFDYPETYNGETEWRPRHRWLLLYTAYWSVRRAWGLPKLDWRENEAFCDLMDACQSLPSGW